MEGKREGAGCSHSQRVVTAACWQVQGSSSGPSRRPPTGRQRLGQVVLEQGYTEPQAESRQQGGLPVTAAAQPQSWV